MENILQMQPKAAVCRDGVLITGASDKEHLENLEKVLRWSSDASSGEKCVFQTGEVTYLGYHIDKDGLHIVEGKVKNLCQEYYCESLGLAHIGTVCEPDKNCAVIQDIGLQSAFTVAHEIGHLLGMPHDSSDVCAQVGELPSANQMMSNMLSRIDYSEPWSRCSNKLSLGFFESKRAECLLNRPQVSLAESQTLAGRNYDADQQCRLTFGPGHRWRPQTDPCRILWCMARRQGMWHHSSKQLPAADGTDCGMGRVCLSGQCVANWQQAKPVDGNWGLWGPWSRCSRTCGGGVQFSRRRCDNPLPAAFGRYCQGRREIFQSCNLDPCPYNNGRTYRDEQCEARNGPDPNEQGRYLEWEPYYHGIREPDLCKLNCLLRSTSQVNVFHIRVKDGTRCSPHSDAVCVRNRCVKTGCDGVIGSNKRYNKCGICGGLDTVCQRVIRRFRNSTVNYNDVVVIPAGAANFKARQEFRRGQTRFTAYLALKRANGTYVLNGNTQISGFESLIDVGGVALRYTGWSPRRDAVEAITHGVLTEPLTLQVYNPSRQRVVRILYSYYLRRAEVRGEGQGGAHASIPRQPTATSVHAPLHLTLPTHVPGTARPNATLPTATVRPRTPASTSPTTTMPTATVRPRTPASTSPTTTLPTATVRPRTPASTSPTTTMPTATVRPRTPASTSPTTTMPTATVRPRTPVPTSPTTTLPTATVRPRTPVPTSPTTTLPTATVRPRTPAPALPIVTLPTARVPTRKAVPPSLSPALPSHTQTPTMTSSSLPNSTVTPVEKTTERWYAGRWQSCSAKCGVGWRVRWVRCLNGNDVHKGGCNQQRKPKAMALCVKRRC
ncbi:LOW QUALITY PROTEIN: A disintegrin and metalloproteinase with thrombospondin motifs 5-like [Scyliorhinus canicula]|uniref:LOW QUALITY PROTEIN: A disintegrin and metalloproteinase with thrombospondin motifs 5-like n=1 Tax=Scyliorhinus canicula TaxID=7830 RepID=UPI0018F315E7|nr:LOW QUALITY PROTEIN: A disintegrin and metalloproteinase with thrombospondin motifs 5-like [Scyliorhinus canicula]